MMTMMAERVLGVEGGGTKTAWVLVENGEAESRVVEEGKLPPSNFRLTPPDLLRAILSQLPKQSDRAGIFLAGCAPGEDQRQLLRLCTEIWPSAQIVVGNDRDSGLAAALQDRDGIVVNAGTGSSVTGRRGRQIEKAGGWGHILGDTGGGYYLSIEALRLVLREHDLRRAEADFAADILRALSLNNFDELVRWVQTADKMQVAVLAPVVFGAAEKGDVRVRELLQSGAAMLARYTHAVATRLGFEAPEVRLLGGLFRCCDIYQTAFRTELEELLPRADVELTQRTPEMGAAWLASRPRQHDEVIFSDETASEPMLASAATEQRNPRSNRLDQLDSRELVELFVEEERFVQEALRRCVPELAAAVDLVASALRNAGRLFYVGAGTSGRLGVLDASEIPPTFGASPELVQGIIAGGASALHRSVEGAEDNTAAGALAIEERHVTALDVVCGITASGRTPFVLGALARAKAIGASTILLTSNPAGERASPADLQINLPTGPELIAGSTRLKAGTATKVALNIISSGAMVALGKVRGNLMIDVTASNTKLRDRAVRIVAELANCSYDEALTRLAAADWNLRAAIDPT
jgi:N-acetylmuramic acid 6-phosphate etherase